ncbi:alpha/beta fold hydrolase [Bifidobacterium favimelis]|uniref:Alpha/beta hydrolase n=1 Tax=Bifidobacterium favimelis TaxID=3122979 RepID=A0ABU8ZQF3_9BIFI
MTSLHAVGRGRPFGDLPVPGNVEVLVIHAPVGDLTALHCPKGARGERGTALLIPGFTGSKEDFYQMIPLLGEAGWDVWAYSQRGQADSVAPPGRCAYDRGSTAADALDVARIIIEQTGVKRVHLLGHSFGGVVAQAAALTGPGLFASLTLMSSGPHGWPGRKADIRQRLLDHPGGDLWRLDNPDRASMPDEDLGTQDRFQRLRAERTSRDQLIGAIDQLADLHDRTEQLAATGLPVLVFHGEDDDNAWPQDWQARMARLLGARYEIIPGAGHCPNIDRPEATAALLDDFWASVSAER